MGLRVEMERRLGATLQRMELAELVRGYCENVTAADSPREAVELSRLLAGEDGVVVAFGSLSFQGKIIRAITESMGGSDGKRKKN